MKPERPAETADRPAATLKIPLATMAGTGERQRLLRRALREAAMSPLGLRRQGGPAAAQQREGQAPAATPAPTAQLHRMVRATHRRPRMRPAGREAMTQSSEEAI